MTSRIENPVGYIAYDADGGSFGAIYGYGRSPGWAWRSLLREMAEARVTVVGKIDDEEIVCEPYQTPANRYRIAPASEQLIAAVKAQGGRIAWEMIDGVAQAK